MSRALQKPVTELPATVAAAELGHCLLSFAQGLHKSMTIDECHISSAKLDHLEQLRCVHSIALLVLSSTASVCSLQSSAMLQRLYAKGAS